MKILLPILLALSLYVIACKNKGTGNQHGHHHAAKNPQTAEDSLFEEVMQGHDDGMARYGKLKEMEKKLSSLSDSISKLSAAVKQKLAPYKEQVDKTVIELRNAIQGMDKWMDEFSVDSAKENMERRMKYLMDEKVKVNKVKEDIFRSLSKADSLLKVKL
ncbi:MAG: hypothetical protein N2747_00025 [Chitinophagaceae bacterium]|nr:hypothetical protein [Chitinophagaceae bacterium]